MLEAIISLRRDNKTDKIGGKETAIKEVGDIIAVKKSPAIWGSEEKKKFLIVFLKDDALEASMKRDRRIYPYAVFEDVETPWGTESQRVSRSGYRVDTAAFVASPALDPTVETGPVKPTGKDCLELKDLIIADGRRSLADG